MNKLGVAAAVLAVLVGIVAISSVSASKNEEFDFEGEGLENPRHELRGEKNLRGRREHKPHPPPPPPPHKRRGRRPRVCEGGFEGGRGAEFEGEEENFGRSGRFEGGRGEFLEEDEGDFRRGGNVRGGRGGSFKGAGVFGAVGKEKEFDANVRADSRHSNRNGFNKQGSLVVGEQKAVGGGVSHGEANSVSGIHKHKNINNDKLIVKETQRGNEDVDGFQNSNSRNDEGHFGASDTKVLGVQGSESAVSDQESEKDFEAGVHKKESFGAAKGAGVVGGRF